METFKNLTIALIFLLVIDAYAENNPLVDWKFKTNNAIHATPLVDDSVIYLGSTDKNFYAINKHNGTRIWNFTTPFEINSKATVNDSLVFFESGFKLYALDKETGQLRWSYVASENKPEMSIGFTDYHHSSPIIYKDNIFFGDGWGNLNGVDIKTGNLVFQYTVKTDSAAIRSTPAIQNDTIFFGDWAGHVYAVSLTNKSLLWQYTLIKRRPYYGMVTSDMVIKDSLLYFGSQHDVFSPINIKTGKPEWTFIDPYQTYLPSTPVFYKNSVIIGSTINAFKVYSLTNGKVNWSCSSDGIFFIHPVIVDSVVIMNTSNFGGNGTIFMINANNGKLMNEYHFVQAAPASPVVSGNKLYIGNGDGYLYAFDLKKLMYPNDDSSLIMDTSTVNVNFQKGDANHKIPILIENKGLACDSFYMSYEIKGNPENKGIVIPINKKGHIWVAGKYTAKITVSPTILNMGDYSVLVRLKCARHPKIEQNKLVTIKIKDLDNADILKENDNLKVYPNPANENVNFEFKKKAKIQLRVYSANGSIVYSYSGMSINKKIVWNTSACKNGTYVYKFSDGDLISGGVISLSK